ncbi:flavin monoamine oxidase family protein [Glycomyces tenuis]|uniref:flavin monoamine oxidase family protein n=1 Tax=Glycomyces tenuis TaxID=58116 RepID=UPI00040362A3|nr:NAD(P)/FAD-dependent oxidoreductase [Glycomyces tenuis]
MSRGDHRSEVLVVGAGLAGLSAADRLVRAGVQVRVLEASSGVGGRVRGEWSGQRLVDVGAEFFGGPHRRIRALITALGLRIQPAELERAPVLWRLPERHRVTRLPPLPLPELWHLGRAWWQLRRHALKLDPDRPWDCPAATGLDEASLADWLASHGATERGLEVTEALVGGFATRPIGQVSAAHAAWWITAADGLLAAWRSGQQYVVDGGAHQIPHRLADRLGDRIMTGTPVTTITEHRDGVVLGTGERQWAADAAILAIPLPALRHMAIDPPPAPGLREAIEQLSYGHAVKIAATARRTPPVAHRAVVGGQPLAIAWRHGRTLAGIATTEATGDALSNDLATAFGLAPDDLTGTAVTDWTHEPGIGGSYLVYAPGQLTGHAPALHHSRPTRIRYAGADFSSWLNSMEGAVQSGQAAAADLLAAPRTLA